MMEGDEEEEGAGSNGVGGKSQRDMGSLTGWQALANEVIAELGSGPQPGASQEPAPERAFADDEEEDMQVSPGCLPQYDSCSPSGTQ